MIGKLPPLPLSVLHSPQTLMQIFHPNDQTFHQSSLFVISLCIMASFPPFAEAMFDINLNSPLEQRQDKQEDSNICSYVHDHPSTEAFDLRRTFSLQIRFSSAHTVVDCRGSKPRTNDTAIHISLVRILQIGIVHSIINEEPSIQ